MIRPQCVHYYKNDITIRGGTTPAEKEKQKNTYKYTHTTVLQELHLSARVTSNILLELIINQTTALCDMQYSHNAYPKPLQPLRFDDYLLRIWPLILNSSNS